MNKNHKIFNKKLKMNKIFRMIKISEFNNKINKNKQIN